VDGMMPEGLNGEKRPADVNGAAFLVARIAVGGIEEDITPHWLPQERRSRG